MTSPSDSYYTLQPDPRYVAYPPPVQFAGPPLSSIPPSVPPLPINPRNVPPPDVTVREFYQPTSVSMTNFPVIPVIKKKFDPPENLLF